MNCKVLAIKRSPEYSPGNVEADAAILQGVVDKLCQTGAEVQIISEDELKGLPTIPPIVVNMCRKDESIAFLKELEKTGTMVINSAFGIENCQREKMTLLFKENGIPTPENIIVNTTGISLDSSLQNGIEKCWVKKGVGHTLCEDDIRFCKSGEEVADVIHEFYSRGIHKAIISRHAEGDQIKFYGVDGQPFFYTTPCRYLYDLNELKMIASTLSKIFGVSIFGGDCIIGIDGSISILDFNDWPSFKSCRDKAIPHIAECIISKIEGSQQ
ncbi:MAG: hypothetical protein J1F38_02725 [Muribaculaceae bacterium]|nr:hypothetical protein [Muribaculaceae bacterium]